MQRYHAGSCTSAVNNGSIGGIPARDTSRAESSVVPPPANFSLNSRRSSQLTTYKLRCDKESLNSRLGPPDFHPQTPNCPEETLTREYVQSGYRETVEGLEEAREITLSQVQTFTKPVIVNCKEAIRKRHRAINESRAQKRKAGQVYGVPLSGTLLTKPGIFPEQRPYGEDARKKWLEGLSQQHKRLCSLADHAPHGYRRKSLFEVLIRNNVPLVRAAWFIKVTYLNQVRPGSSSSSSGAHDKTQFSRSELWTKDIIDYLQYLLDEFVIRNNSRSSLHIRDRSSQMVYAGSMLAKGDQLSAATDGEGPSPYFKWWYVVRIIQWQHAEGLLIPSLIIEWFLSQLQEKELASVLQLLLPIIYGFIETAVLCQTYVRTLVGIAVRFIKEPSPGGSDLVDNSRRAYTTTALVEMLRYLIQAVPDTFVALDCFPLPTCVVTHLVNDGSSLSKTSEDARKKGGPPEVTGVLRDKIHEIQIESLAIDRAVSSIQKRTETLARAAKPDHRGHSVAKASQVLDKVLVHGDIRVAYQLLYGYLWDGTVAECWIAEVSPGLRSSLKHIGRVTSSLICSTFFICEWAACDFRDFRTVRPHGMQFTGTKDFSQIYIAMRLLKQKMGDMQNLNSLKRKHKDSSDTFESPSPLHDIIVCWIDQHEVHNREGFKRLQLLVREFVQAGIFHPQVYVRQLIVSGIVDGHGSMSDLEKRKRHHRILKQLHGPYVFNLMEEAQIIEPSVVTEVMNVYSNERRLVLRGLLDHSRSPGRKSSNQKLKRHPSSGGGSADQWSIHSTSNLQSKYVDADIEIEELKASITALLQFPSDILPMDTGLDESQGSAKRSNGANNRVDLSEETPGCEECRSVKRQRLSEERIFDLKLIPTDEEETWWVRKGMKSMESFKGDPPPKPAKLQGSRGRQKTGRKTQSLAQLAAARIEGSQGASTSHVCESRIGCPHHRTGFEDAAKSMDGIRTSHSGDVISIGKLIKQMQNGEKRKVTVWMISVVKQLVEEAEKTTAKVGQYGRPFPAVDDRSSVPWKLGEDELSSILYLMDICNELIPAIKFLLWLLPKVLSSPGSSFHSGRNIPMLPRNAENYACDVEEAFLLSSIRRYENVIVAADLIPETLSASMHRTATVMTSNGRVSSSPAFVYARYLLKKYSNVASVIEWEKTFKSTCDKRLSSELESGRSVEGDYGFPLGAPAGVEDLDDYFRQKINGGRVSRVGLSMKDIVQRHMDEAFNYFHNKEKKLFGPGMNKNPSMEKRDDGYRIAQKIVIGLMDCMRQTGGAAQEGDPSLVSSAIAAIINNLGLVIAKIPDFTTVNHLNSPSPSGSLQFARRILRIHITCLCILKEALGERHSRVFDVALAAEASSALMQASAPGKAPRSQFHLSSDSHDSNANSPNEFLNHSTKPVIGRAAKITAAVAALVIGAILQGVASLERMVILFRLKEGLDLIQFARSVKSTANGNARSMGYSKLDNLIEVSVIWFRVLVGNCRTISDGFIVDLLGEASIVALSRMQRSLPLNLVFPPAYSIFAFVIWRPFILNASSGQREDIHQLYQSMALGIGDAIKHLPFREICLRDTHGFYDLVAADTLDYEFASIVESTTLDTNLKASAFVPLRARLFLEALIDCRMPQPMFKQDDGNWTFSLGESKSQRADNVKKLLDKLVHVLDTLQPARFHWQWVELRLILNEQAIIEKMENPDISLIEAIRSLSPNPDNISDNESNFIQIILTRLLVRPDAAPLFSEAVHLLGRSLEDSMLLQAKWLLRGQNVLYGRKSIRQKIINIAEPKKLCLKAQNWKPWGWCPSSINPVTEKGDKLKSEAAALEEGEVVDEGSDFGHSWKGSGQVVDVEGFIVSQQHVTEKALIELVLPCVDRGSDESRSNFASEMIKQVSNIEQQINAVTRGAGKPAEAPASGVGSPANKSNTRKGGKGGSPGLPKQSTGSTDTVPPSPPALRASITLRLQFLLRLLPIICADRETPGRNMRYTLASVILRLLGSTVVHEDANHIFNSTLTPLNSTLTPLKRGVESLVGTSTASELPSMESLFDDLLLVFHALLSNCLPSWLKLKSDSKSIEYAVFDREVAERFQNDLNRMELPETIRWRIQTAMPILFPSPRLMNSCQPPSVSPAALAFLQPSNPMTALNPLNSTLPPRNLPLPSRTGTNVKTKALQLQHDFDMEIDPWTLLEDGAGSGQPSVNSALVGSSDHANLKASSWLKGAVRVRRTDLTYIGAVDEEN
ncbi:mediator of RNA polymerase II transcription subunit 12 [Olea europaea subsp. europaea]|uniref:Mediator of RNA polymerase II transcription subunit 12 n=2 Tax=Olea europaea subsp. europaea TaxID=158383 RepID=A0A8S0PBL7_OLEEU|nr:mediator of RNA polymerase II transcription subunit 12 [Olea europaea subsp. europaea]